MKHYVIRNGPNRSNNLTQETRDRKIFVDVILPDPKARGSAEMVVEFYQALNKLVDDYTYVVDMRLPAQEFAGGPLHWKSRVAVFWGDIDTAWSIQGSEKSWIPQVIGLSPRSILVGGAVFLLAQTGRAYGAEAAVHPNFVTAARETGIRHCGTGTCMATAGRVHSATSRLSALRLMSNFVSLDHGEHLAETLRGYIGLSEPKQQYQSRIAARLIHRSGGDDLVALVLDTMLEHIEDPLRITDLSEIAQTSTRQLQRRFLNKTGAKLLTTYSDLRLERADSLLRHTDMTRLEIATATGFSSVSALCRKFRYRYRISPEHVRSQRFTGQLPD